MTGMEPIYLDYNATSPIAPEVLEETTVALRDLWGNPSSDHVHGRRAREAVERARHRVAALLGCRDGEIVFTSGGTESDNAAVFGVAEALAGRGKHIVVSAIEHAAVGDAATRLEHRGFAVTRVPVDRAGLVDPDDVARAVRDDTVLVSIMHSHNETGVLQPVREIARHARSRGIVVHTDAAQSVGKLPVAVDELEVDLLTVAGHKLYGPKGVGALYLRQGTPFEPLFRGAGHEGNRRSGTENTACIVGLGAACELACAEPDRPMKLRRLRDRLEAGLRRIVPDLVVHGGETERLPNTLYAAIPGVPAHELLAGLPEIAAGSGAACHSTEPAPSRVLLAMGVPAQLAVCTVRLSLGRPTTAEEIDRASALIGRRAEALRAARG